MKVALLSRSAHPLHEPGGLERAVFDLARHLDRAGVEVTLYTRPASRAGAFPGRVVGVPYGHLPGLRHGRVLDRAWLYPRFADRLGARVAADVASGGLDIVHAQGLSGLGYARRRRAGGLSAPLVTNPQGMEEHHAVGLKALLLARVRRLSREAAALSDRVIATDEATRADVPRLLGVDPDRVVVVPNGLDLDAVATATPPDARSFAERRVPGLEGAEPVFLSVGRLEAYKGFGDVLAALLRLHREQGLPAGWAWVVAGDGPLRATLARAATQAPGHVHLLGRVDEATLHALYARADAFVHATRFEGSSLVTLEAMAHALPVLATRAGGIPDKVVPGETGLLVTPGDPTGLAQGLRALAAGPERRREWGAAGRRLVAARFAWPALAARTVALYEELLAESRG